MFSKWGVAPGIIAYECNHYSLNIHAYTIGFEEKKYDESGYADIMVLKNHLKILNYQDIDKLPNRLRIWYDEPFTDTSVYLSYIITTLARWDAKGILTEDGDELFGQYDRYVLYADSVDRK